MNIWIIVSFFAGIAAGILCAKVFFPSLALRYKIVEKVVEKTVESPEEEEKENNSGVPKRYAKKA